MQDVRTSENVSGSAGLCTSVSLHYCSKSLLLADLAGLANGIIVLSQYCHVDAARVSPFVVRNDESGCMRGMNRWAGQAP